MTDLERIKKDVVEMDSRANVCWYDTKVLTKAVRLILEELTADRKTEPQMGDAKPIPLSSRITQTEPQTMYYPQVDGIRPILTVKAEPNCSEKPNNCEENE